LRHVEHCLSMHCGGRPAIGFDTIGNATGRAGNTLVAGKVIYVHNFGAIPAFDDVDPIQS
jgi:hypothetical protein